MLNLFGSDFGVAEEGGRTFVLSADELNAAEIPATLTTVAVPTNTIFVPTRLVLQREAGTAYTLGRSPVPSQSHEKFVALTGEPNLDQRVAEEMEDIPQLIIRSGSITNGVDRFQGRPLFRVPLVPLLRETSATTILATPLFTSWWHNSKSVRIEYASNVAISGGTGRLFGALFYDIVTAPPVSY